MSHIPSYALYGETHDFPDVLHIERIYDRAKGLDWTIAPHRHAKLHQFFMIHQGVVAFSIDEKRITFDRPTLLSVPAFHVHGFHFSPNTQGFVLSCPSSEIDALSQGDRDIQHIRNAALELAADADIQSLFHTIYTEFQHETMARTAMLRAQLLVLLCHLARRRPPTTPLDTVGVFHRFERMLMAHPERPIQIDAFARDLGLSRTGLHRACRSATGQSAHRVAMQIKIQEAKRRLAYTQESTSEIAYRLGFDDPSYFTKVFRKYAGTTPSGYRKPFLLTPSQ